MGDMADWTINQGIDHDAQEIESWSKARELSDAEIVKALVSYKDCDENVLAPDFAAKVKSICQWHKDKGFLTQKQRNCLNAAFVEIDIVL